MKLIALGVLIVGIVFLVRRLAMEGLRALRMARGGGL